VQAAQEGAAAGVPAQDVCQGGELAAGRLRVGGCGGGVAAAAFGRGAAPGQRGANGLRVQLPGLGVDCVDPGFSWRGQALLIRPAAGARPACRNARRPRGRRPEPKGIGPRRIRGTGVEVLGMGGREPGPLPGGIAPEFVPCCGFAQLPRRAGCPAAPPGGPGLLLGRLAGVVGVLPCRAQGAVVAPVPGEDLVGPQWPALCVRAVLM